MCGRFVAFSSADAIADRLALQVISDGARMLPPNWNVAPTNMIRIVKPDNEGNEILDVAKWGLLTPWAKGGTGIINARVETVAEKPAFAKAFTNRRCIVPVDGYYEWQKTHDGKQPWFITSSEPVEAVGSPGYALYFAGIYNGSDDNRNVATLTVAILTAAAAPDVVAIHHRMPVSFQPRFFEQWLYGTPDDALALLPNADQQFTKWEVSREVNSVHNNGAQLIEPLLSEPEAQELTLF